ncbi:MAG TPA: PAS domain S-box protein [Candidatus Dormibacteraeota bacterium]|nr:PAS domain S-box protein [Candidatus Dormibacteraeota bacterium]
MAFQDLPIKWKVVAVNMLTTLSALLLAALAFVVYDFYAYRQTLIQSLSTSASLIANNSTAALMFEDEETARQILSALRAEQHVQSAALYDTRGNLFVRYPVDSNPGDFPVTVDQAGYKLQDGHLLMFRPVIEGTKRAGMLYLRYDLSPLYARPRVYGGVLVLVLLGSLIAAFLISGGLQQRITGPIMALAGSARLVSEKGDYSVRTKKFSNDELGRLTDAFNLMLTRIQEQTLALRESEEQRRLALEASRVGIWNWNPDTNRVVWDEQTRAIYGIQKPEVSGSFDEFLGFIHPEDRPTVRNLMSTALRERSEFNADFRVVWPDGSVHDLLSRGKAFYDDKGIPVRFSGISSDVTERRKAEESRSFLAAVVTSSDDAIIGKNMEGRIVSWNAGAERMFGYSAAEMLGQSVQMLLSPDRPEEENKILASARTGQISHFETVRLRKGGQPIHVALTISPIRAVDGRIIGVSTTGRDITERIRAQHALEEHAAVLHEQAQMLDLANVMARDLEDRVILWNSGMQKMYGWTKEEALGKVSHRLLKSLLPEPLDKIRETLFEKGRWEGEIGHVRKDGQPLLVSSLWILHHDPQGKPAAILEINNDITERKNAEEQVLRLNAELERRVTDRTAQLTAANQELEAFTYSVAHDLRAPLRHIDAFARILDEDYGGQLPQEAKKYLENIRLGSRNMSRLVDDLLNLARVGRQELRQNPTPLNQIVNDVLSDLKSDTEGRHIEWRIAQLPTVRCDPGLMKLVFANLMSNAVKYTRPRDPAVIEIGADRENGDPALFVRDNGVGFSMKYADKLFGVFQRLHRSEEFEGTGVGLATVDRIIRKHGGNVWAEAELNKGATFYFTLSTHSNGARKEKRS